MAKGELKHGRRSGLGCRTLTYVCSLEKLQLTFKAVA